MLTSEIRKELEKYNKKELENIILELYKRIPKKTKEVHKIDNCLKDFNTYKKKDNINLSFEELVKEIKVFIIYVDEGYYVRQNKIVSDKERKEWRHKVKRYIKELNKYDPTTENGHECTKLLIELFKRVSVGSNSLLFSNWETFRAIGMEQEEFYELIIKRVLANGYTKNNVKFCVDLLDTDQDPYGWGISMFKTYINNMKTVDMRELSILLFQEKVSYCEDEVATKDKYNSSRYYYESLANDYIKGILDLYILLYNTEEGITYFHKHYFEDDEEIKEYVLLEILKRKKMYKEYIKEYEAHPKIDYRDSLKKDYQECLKIVEKE